MKPNVNFALNSIFDHVHRHMKPISKNAVFPEETRRYHPIKIKPMTLREVQYGPIELAETDTSQPRSHRRSSSYSKTKSYPKVPQRRSKAQVTTNNSSMNHLNKTFTSNQAPPMQTPIHTVMPRPSKFRGMHSANIIAAPAMVPPSRYQNQLQKTIQPKEPLTKAPRKNSKKKRSTVGQVQNSLVPNNQAEIPSNANNIRVNKVLQLRSSLQNMLKDFYKLKSERENITRDLMVLRETLKNMNVTLDHSYERLNSPKALLDGKGKRGTKKASKLGYPRQMAMQDEVAHMVQ